MISVVTITFNNPEELIATLSTLKMVKEIESIVINGGSSQETNLFLEGHFGKTLSEPDRGISDAFNKGSKLSSGVAVAFLNSGDILIDREYYSWATKVFKEKPDVGFVYSDIVFNDALAGKVLMKPRGKSLNDLGAGMPFPHPSLIVRRELFAELGGFSERYKIAMDFDLVVRLLKAGHTGIYYPHATVEMDGSGVSSTNELRGIQESRRSLVENGIFYGQVAWSFQKRKLTYYARIGIKRLFGAGFLGMLKRQANPKIK